MKRIITILASVSILVLSMSSCFNKKATQSATKVKDPMLVTHKEAVDTLRADSTAPLKNLVITPLKSKASYDFLKAKDLSAMFIEQYPTNGFFGEDHYRIEFIFTEVKKDSFNVNMYHVKGKNRHKKVITPFEGTFRVIDLVQIQDPNLDTASLREMNIAGIYGAKGAFEFKEDPKMAATSGEFRGNFVFEFSETKDKQFDFWYFSENLPSKGAGYRFDGTWTMYKDPNVVKPVLWARDIFRFANDILKDFSIGERDVEINPQYRKLGWDEFWSGEEWWNTTAKKKEM